jgi:prefoldin subunit 5
MTDRQLLEQIAARLDAIDGRLDRLESLVAGFIQTTESNFTRVFERLDRFERQFELLDGRIDLIQQELLSIKIFYKSRIDRVEKRPEQLEQR